LPSPRRAVTTEVTNGRNPGCCAIPTKPARAGIDPMNKLVDRGSDDNTTPLTD
jgi:hypothetical protein